MNLVDSSGWLEYFSEGTNADFFSPPILDLKILVVSTINIYEVFKKILIEKNEDIALRAVAAMQLGQVKDVDYRIALFAAKFSREFKLPMADSLIYATAKSCKATLWTQDSDFRNFEEVQYIEKQ